jgi:hypothetical protein
MKDGYGYERRREVILEGESDHYRVVQFEGYEYASIELISRDGQVVWLNANFDPTGKIKPNGGWGYPPDRVMSAKEWTAHLRQALSLLKAWGGYQRFDRLEYQTFYFNLRENREVSPEEALE